MLPVHQYITIFKAVWPHILSIIALTIYIVVGAYLFIQLEQKSEQNKKAQGLQMVKDEKLKLEKLCTSLIAIETASDDSRSLLDLMLNNDTANYSMPALLWRQKFEEALAHYDRVLLKAWKENYLEHSTMYHGDKTEDLWTLPAAVLFAFSAVTTIGYGNIAPTTFYGRLFCIFYGLIGIPFAMLVLANVGKFLSEGLRHIIALTWRFWKRCKSKLRNRLNCCVRWKKSDDTNNNSDHCSLSTSTEDEMDRNVDQPLPVILLIVLVFGYICLGALILPQWEESFDFFDAFYFNFITITTTGFGDLVPQKYTFLAVTLIYVAVGISMTTMCIEAAAAYMRKLHYIGRRIQGAKFTRIRFGDKMITVDELITSLGVKFGVPTMEVAKLKSKFDAFVVTAIETKDLDEERKAQVLNAFDLADNQCPNGGADTVRDDDTSTTASMVFPDLTAPLWRLLGAFHISAEDIRYIDDEERYDSVV